MMERIAVIGCGGTGKSTLSRALSEMINFLKWICGYNKNQKPIIIEKLKNLSNEKNVTILNSTSEVKRFIYALKEVQHE